MVAEFFTGVVWATTFFSLTELEVKKFSEYFPLLRTLDSEFFRGGVQAPTFFGHAKFEGKFFQNFIIYRALWTEFLAGGSGLQLFLVMLNLRSKSF